MLLLQRKSWRHLLTISIILYFLINVKDHMRNMLIPKDLYKSNCKIWPLIILMTGLCVPANSALDLYRQVFLSIAWEERLNDCNKTWAKLQKLLSTWIPSNVTMILVHKNLYRKNSTRNYYFRKGEWFLLKLLFWMSHSQLHDNIFVQMK